MTAISTSDFKLYRGIPSGTTTYDALIALLIPRAQRKAERYCDTRFEQATWTELYDGGAESIQLRNLPVASVTSVAILTTSGGSTTLASTDYVTNLNTGELRCAGADYCLTSNYESGIARHGFGRFPRFPQGLQNVSVVYVGGYDSGSIPDDLKQALCEEVDDLFTPIYMGGGDPKQYQSEKIGDYAYSRRSMTESIQVFKQRWNPFRRGRV